MYKYDTLEEAIDASNEINNLGNRFCKNNQRCDFKTELGIGNDSYYVTLTIIRT